MAYIGEKTRISNKLYVVNCFITCVFIGFKGLERLSLPVILGMGE